MENKDEYSRFGSRGRRGVDKIVKNTLQVHIVGSQDYLILITQGRYLRRLASGMVKCECVMSLRDK